MNFRHAVALFIALTLSCEAAQATVQPTAPVEQTASTGQSFDKRFSQIDSIDFHIEGPEHRQQLLAELKTLLPAGDEHRGRMYRSMRCTLDFEKDFEAGLAFAKAELAAAEAAVDHIASVRFRLCMISYMEILGASPRETMPLYKKAIDEAKITGSADLLGYSYTFRGATNSILGEQALALIDFLEAQRIFEAAGLKKDAEANLFSIAVAYRRMGNFDKATQYFRQREASAKAKGDEIDLIGIHSNLGFIHEEKGELDAAEAEFKKAIELARENKRRVSIGAARLALSSILVLKGQYQKALNTLALAKADLASEGPIDPSNQALLALYAGKAKAGLGKHHEASAEYVAAEKALLGSENIRYQAMLYAAQAENYEALGHPSNALKALKHYVSTQSALTEKTRSEQTLFLQHQFDSTRRDLENQQLNAEKLLREQELASLVKERRWQWAAIVLAAIVLAMLSALVVRQVLRLRRLQVLALTDALTGVANRRRIERFADEQIEQSLAQKRTFTIITLDIDYFKRLNDNHGHGAGDQALVRVSTACQGALRAFDVIGRTGGEEFLVVLPRSHLADGAQVAERLRAAVNALVLDDISPGLTVSISLGVAEFKPEDKHLKELMRRADNALYRAKANGRNRVEIES